MQEEIKDLMDEKCGLASPSLKEQDSYIFVSFLSAVHAKICLFVL